MNHGSGLNVIRLFRKELKKILLIFKHPTFIFLTVGGNIVLLAASYVLYFLEKGINPKINTYFDSLWWGIATITTVAYGDIVPITFAGRLVGIVLIYTGTVLFVTFTGVILFLLTKEEVKTEMRPLEKEIRKEEKEQAHIEILLMDVIKRLERIEKRERFI
jgi:voltage-gated potassium channel